LGRAAAGFSPEGPRQFFAQRRQAQSALHQNLGAEALLFAQNSEQQVLGRHVFHAQPLGFFRGHIQDALAFGAQRHFHARGNPSRIVMRASISFRMDSIEPCCRRNSVGQRLVFPHQTQEKVLGLDVGAAVLAGFVSRKENSRGALFPCSVRTR
jgi:hypothetical protein